MLLYRNICIVCCRAAADDKIFPQKKQTGTDQHECINWQNGNRHGDNSGRVKIDGDVWRAIASKGEIIEIGEEAIVEQVNSTILTVKKL